MKQSLCSSFKGRSLVQWDLRWINSLLTRCTSYIYRVSQAHTMSHSYLSILTCISYFRVMWKHQDPSPTAENKSKPWLMSKSTCETFRYINWNAWTSLGKKKIKTSVSPFRDNPPIFQSLLLQLPEMSLKLQGLGGESFLLWILYPMNWWNL